MRSMTWEMTDIPKIYVIVVIFQLMKDFLTLLKLNSITNYQIHQISVIYPYHIWQQEQVQWVVMNAIAFFVNKIRLEGLKLNKKVLLFHKFVLNVSKRQVAGFNTHAWHHC